MKKYILVGMLVMILLLVLALSSCMKGVDYNAFKPSPQEMIDRAELVYKNGMPCLVYIGTNTEDTYTFATCDWSQYGK